MIIMPHHHIYIYMTGLSSLSCLFYSLLGSNKMADLVVVTIGGGNDSSNFTDKKLQADRNCFVNRFYCQLFIAGTLKGSMLS